MKKEIKRKRKTSIEKNIKEILEHDNVDWVTVRFSKKKKKSTR